MDQRNLITAVILSMAIIFSWDFFVEAPRREQALLLEQNTLTEENIADGTTTTGDGDIRVRAEDAPAQQGVEQGAGQGAGQNDTSSLSVSDRVEEDNGEGLRAATLDNAPRIAIETPSVRGSISLKGARIDDIILKNYRETLDPESPEIVLFHKTGSETPYYASFGWAGIEDAPTADTVWQASATVLTPDNPVTLSWQNSGGLIFYQDIAIDADYLLTINQRVKNRSDTVFALSPFGLIARNGTPDILGFYILHEGPISVWNDKLHEIDYDDFEDSESVNLGEGSNGWLGITDKYWLASLVPSSGSVVTASFKYGTRQNVLGREMAIYQADFIGQKIRVAPGAEISFESRLFAGAKKVHLLDSYGEEHNINRFDLAVDFGWFYFLTKPVFHLLAWLFSLAGNFGVAILLLTVLIRILFFPLAHKSFVSMGRMKQLQPDILKIREQFEGDQRKISEEVMGLYRKHKVNPLSGCLPILLQIPVFFSLYKVLFITIEMRHAPFFGWIKDLSAPDPLGVLTAFGLIDWTVPAILGPVNIGIWPILMGTTMWLQQKLNPAPPDQLQQKIFALMPFIFTFLLGSFPAGLVIYWAWNNLLSIAQQWTIVRGLEKGRSKLFVKKS